MSRKFARVRLSQGERLPTVRVSAAEGASIRFRPVRVSQLQQNDQRDAFDGVVASIHVIAHEKIVGVCQPTTFM